MWWAEVTRWTGIVGLILAILAAMLAGWDYRKATTKDDAEFYYLLIWVFVGAAVNSSLVIGFGQALIAFRDLVRNSWRATRATECTHSVFRALLDKSARK
ncbi:hypothetical protein RAS2_16960 [Phycisphaerae bacterium RAS2]|nr:hypothetical protein RAS2_16960 [Phycisphaerae bacterium RAS2]